MARLAHALLITLSLTATSQSLPSFEPQGFISPEHFSAYAINTGTFGPPRAGVVDIFVLRWSSPAEKDALTSVLVDKGPPALLDALRDRPTVGYVRTPDSLAYSLFFAWREPTAGGGRRVILVTDRRIGLWEATPRLRTTYPFTLIEMRLSGDGEGEGKISNATKITANTELNLIELEDYAKEPVRLTSVRSGRPLQPREAVIEPSLMTLDQ